MTSAASRSSESQARRRTLDAILDCLIPDDGTPGAAACAIGARLPGSPELDELLDRLVGFEDADAAAQEAALRRLEQEGDATFAALVESAHVAFYADVRSWPALGYTTHVPGRP